MKTTHITNTARVLIAVTLALAGVLLTKPHLAGATGVLPIPRPLTGNWTAPAGSYTMPSVVNVSVTATVDLSAATITGTSGYFFNLLPGANLTIIGGNISGAINGLVQDSVPDGGALATVTINGTQLTNVKSIVFEKAQTGVVNVYLNNVTATGLGDGVRAVANIVDVESSTLTGGGTPPSGNPAGIHMLDDNYNNVALPGTYMKVFNSTITGYTSTGFQGDSLLGETRVESADIENNTLGHNSDSGGIDSKMGSVTFNNNIVYSDGDRGIASHYGTLTATGNTIYQVATSGAGIGRAYQATGTLIAHDDTLILTTGGYLAQSMVATSGSGPLSTYPRVGNITLTHIVDSTGTSILGPTQITPSGGYTPTLVVNP